MTVFYRFARNIAQIFDLKFGTGIKERGGELYRYFLQSWSLFRRKIDPLKIRLSYKLGTQNAKNIRLHLGCGSKHFHGYINVDLWITDATDVICDITHLPWPDNCAETIESYHVLEHISHKSVRKALSEWYRVLAPGGKLILECPNFDAAIQDYLSGNDNRLINIFGQQRHYGDIHLFGYNPARLIKLLEEVGFKDLIEELPQSSQSLDEPSFRIECHKLL
jgi:predicted SAM-dependent methyltransferase